MLPESYEAVLNRYRAEKKRIKALFRFLEKKSKKELDSLFYPLYQEIFFRYDCTECAHCCSVLGPRFADKDVERLAAYFRMKKKQFASAYLETDEDGDPVYETQEEQGSFTLEVGDMAEDGTYYARPQGSTAVYTIDSGDVQTLIDAVQEGDYFATDDVCLMDWDTVDSIEISYGSQTETLEFVRESVDGDDVDESTDTSYRIGGEDADAAAVESMLDAVTGMSAEGEATGSPEEEGFELSLTFRRNTDTFSEMTLGFTKYNNSFYLVSFNEEERLLVNRNDVAELEEMIEAL